MARPTAAGHMRVPEYKKAERSTLSAVPFEFTFSEDILSVRKTRRGLDYNTDR